MAKVSNCFLAVQQVMWLLFLFCSSRVIADQSKTHADFCADCTVVTVAGGTELKGQTSSFRKVAAAVPSEGLRTPAAEEGASTTFGDVFIIAPPNGDTQNVGMGFYIKDSVGACYVLTSAHILQKGKSTEFFKSGIKASLTLGQNEKSWDLQLVGMATEFVTTTPPQLMRDFALLYDPTCRGNILGKYSLSSSSAQMLLAEAGKGIEATKEKEKYRVSRYMSKGNSEVIDVAGVQTTVVDSAGDAQDLVYLSSPTRSGESGAPFYNEVGKDGNVRRVVLAIKKRGSGVPGSGTLAIPTEFITPSVKAWIKTHQASLNDDRIRQAGAGDAVDPTAAKRPN